jgi:protein-S-isoprenylcysteine O-methyltransferase
MHWLSPNIIGPAWGLSELGLSLVKRSKAGATSQDRHSLALIWVVNLTASALAVLLAYQAAGWRLPEWLPARGLGGALTVNVAIVKDHQVVRTGPYRWVRHPSYSGALLMVLGFCLTMGNLASLVMMLVPCGAVMLWRIRIEEVALLQGLGGSYQNYMQSTRRLIPWVY